MDFVRQNKKKQDISCFVTCIPEEAVDKQLKAFWEVEEVELERMPFSEEEEEKCENFYRETTIRHDDGTYEVRLPFKNGAPIIGRSRNIAIAQLLSVEGKLSKDKEQREQYIANMRKYFESGHIVKVHTSENQHKKLINGNETYTCAYLPHHAVIKMTSSTTKCRCVFNASRPTTNGKTLNQHLMTGPTIQDDIMTILLRWRLPRFVISGDIARMYRQIKVNNDDAEYQRIVWREDENSPIEDYKLTTVTFGMTCAAIRTIHKLADDEYDNFPVAAAAAKRDFYVDDFFSGAESIEKVIQLRQEMTKLMKKGGFPIRKWIANDEQILTGVSEEERGVRNIFEFDNCSTVKTLGLQWNPKTDCFTYKTSSIAESDDVPTKRQFLSTTAKIYDPMGWLAPTTILIKILYQQLWVHKIDWDEQIPEEINKIYQKYRIEFPLLEQTRIPRWVQMSGDDHIGLHGFCDASNHAYAAVIYMRVNLFIFNRVKLKSLC